MEINLRPKVFVNEDKKSSLKIENIFLHTVILNGYRKNKGIKERKSLKNAGGCIS